MTTIEAKLARARESKAIHEAKQRRAEKFRQRFFGPLPSPVTLCARTRSYGLTAFGRGLVMASVVLTVAVFVFWEVAR